MADINYLQGTGSVQGTLSGSTPSPIPTYSSPGGGSNAGATLQGSSGGGAVPGVFQAGAPTVIPQNSQPQPLTTDMGPINALARSIPTQIPQQPTSGGFSFMDGSGFGGNGISYQPKMSASSQDVTPTTFPVTASSNTTTPSTDTNSLSGNPVTTQDINSVLTQNTNKQDAMFGGLANLLSSIISAGQNYSNAVQPDQSFATAQQNALNSNLAVSQLDTSLAGGLANVMKKPIPLEFQQGQEAAITRDAAIQRASLVNEAQYYQNVFASAQTTRQQKLDAAQTMYNVSNQNLSTALDLYTKTAPSNIATNYNPYTGDVTTTMRNPLTGQTYNVNAGNIGKQKNYTDFSVQNVFGIPTAIGVMPDGSVDKIPLGNVNPSQNPNPTTSEPTFQQTSSPQPGITTASALLGNWVNGGTSTPASSGYQAAVSQTYQQITGQNLTTATPAQLAENIPALAQGIAVAEGWNSKTSTQHTLNNPGNIIWAGQANATPQVVQTSSGPRTFAKFDTEQHGWEAMYGLLGRKLGASMTASGTGANQSQVEPGTPQYAIQQISRQYPAVGQAITKTANGHYFVDVSQLSGDQINYAQNQVPVYAQGTVRTFTPETTQQLKSIDTTMSNLGNLQGLIQSLPTDPLDPARAANYIKARLGTDPTLARLQESWQSILPDLQAQIGTQGISRLATGFLSNPELSIVPSVTSVRGVAQAMIDQTKQLIANRENEIFGGPPPIDYNSAANSILNGGTVQSSSPVYNQLNQLWGTLVGGNLQ